MNGADLWRVWRQAAVADSRALRLLPARCRTTPAPAHVAVDDWEAVRFRESENERARQYRQRKHTNA